MSGHSKWSKVKHQKATTDVVKAAAFTRASRAITVAVKAGGGNTDPESNFRLRLAIEKAKEVNMPKDNIDRAIEKGSGEGGGEISQVLYEVIGPASSAILIEAATDNNKRCVSMIKNICDHYGGVLASPGAVSYMFHPCGIMEITSTADYDTVLSLALDAGADDISGLDNHTYEIITSPTKLIQVTKYFAEKGIPTQNSELIMKATNPIELADQNQEKVAQLIEQLDQLDDVQNIFTNISDKSVSL